MLGFRLNKPAFRIHFGERLRIHRATVACMYSASGIITLIVAALVGTIVGNLVQLRYFIDKPVMKSPFVRYGALVLAIVIMLNIIPDPDARFSTTELMSYGLWWVLIAFLVSFVRPPTPLPPRGARTADEDSEAVDITTVDAEPLDSDNPEADRRDDR